MISSNGNKIVTGSSCGMLLVTDDYGADKARKWSTQSRETAPWYQYEELGYNYCISNLVVRVAPGQWKHLKHVPKWGKKDINVVVRYQLLEVSVTIQADLIFAEYDSNKDFEKNCFRNIVNINIRYRRNVGNVYRNILD